MDKSGEIHFKGWVGGCFRNSKYDGKYFYVAFQALNKFLFVSFTQLGLIFCEALNEINEILWKKIIYISLKKGENLFFCCFVLFLFCILRSRFSFITYEITARFLLILILEVKLRNCFFFHQDFIFTCGLFRALQGLIQDFFGLFRGLLQGAVKGKL